MAVSGRPAAPSDGSARPMVAPPEWRAVGTGAGNLDHDRRTSESGDVGHNRERDLAHLAAQPFGHAVLQPFGLLLVATPVEVEELDTHAHVGRARVLRCRAPGRRGPCAI